jgi:S1-C subfamily serine protease/uncharacterized protein
MWTLALVLLVFVGNKAAAAFDCGGATLPSTIVICSDPELVRLADERQSVINEARGRIGEDRWPALWEDQKIWVKSYATACGIPPDRPPPIPVPASIRSCFKRAAEARIAYLRGYGLSGAPAPINPGNAALSRIGPGFDCDNAMRPLALLICADIDLSRVDLRFNQAYWALFQQLGPAGQPQLKKDDVQFIEQVQDQCGVPRSGGLSSEAWRSRDCVRDAYEKKRAGWLARLVGEAREEAARSLEKHVALQQALGKLGFALSGPPDGVYARGTRDAIIAWQTARGRTVTGFLGDRDAMALEHEVPSKSQTAAQDANHPQAEPSNSEPKSAATRTVMSEEPRAPKPQPKPVAAGTAFAVSTTGEFLTNYHVVKGCPSVRLELPGTGIDGTVVFTDERNDLALVRSNLTGIQPLRFREGKGIRPADGIVALGFPYAGLLATAAQVTTGTVSALAGLRDDSRFLQLTAPVQPGNSGGPLLDLSGNVVGIISARINDLAVAEATGTLPQNINFAIKSTTAREFLDAHRVDYTTSQPGPKLEPADVGEIAAKSTAMVKCYR